MNNVGINVLIHFRYYLFYFISFSGWFLLVMTYFNVPTLKKIINKLIKFRKKLKTTEQLKIKKFALFGL